MALAGWLAAKSLAARGHFKFNVESALFSRVMTEFD